MSSVFDDQGFGPKVFTSNELTTCASLMGREPFFSEFEQDDELMMLNSRSVEDVIIPMDTDAILSIYDWVDSVPLSRTRKHMGRDFSDGVRKFNE